MIGALALADIRDRVRRPSFLVVLVATLVLTYYAVPPRNARYSLFYVGDGYVGVYNSAYLGTVTALACGLWLSLVGFYIVGNSVARDGRTGVGELLAGTPMHNVTYTLGRALSNFVLLAMIMAAAAIMTVVVQLVRGESKSVDLVAMWTPFLLLALPPLALTASAAVFFELTRVLRTATGYVVWFFGWTVTAIASQAVGQSGPGGISFDLLGLGPVGTSMETVVQQQFPGNQSPSASLGLMFDQTVHGRFTWQGFPVDGELLLSRGLWVVVAIVIAAIPALWFDRFAPSAGRARAGLRRGKAAPAAVSAPPLSESRGPVELRTRVVRGPVLARLISGELRILLAQAPRWWLAVAAALAAAGAAVPPHESITILLPLAWIWPILLWSALGTHQFENGVDSLMAPMPAPRRRALAEWLAGAVLTAATGIGPLIRTAAAGDTANLTAWIGGVLLIPALALALGSLTRSARAFQFVYLVLWYVAWNTGKGVNLLGAGTTLPVLAAATAILLAAVLLLRDRREALR